MKGSTSKWFKWTSTLNEQHFRKSEKKENGAYQDEDVFFCWARQNFGKDAKKKAHTRGTN